MEDEKLEKVVNSEPNDEPTEKSSTNEKLFTQEQINEMIQKRLERSHKSFFDRYGVNNLNELDDLFGKVEELKSVNEEKQNLERELEELNNKYNELSTQNTELTNTHTDLTNQFKELSKRHALTSRKIKPDLYSDIEAYFKGKELELNEANLDEELKTHESWIEQQNQVVPLYNELKPIEETSEKDIASKIFGVDF